MDGGVAMVGGVEAGALPIEEELAQDEEISV